MVKLLNVDKEGFLLELSDWNADAAVALAKSEGIDLTDEHWPIINIVRAYYHQYHVSPPTRVLVKVVREELGNDKGQSIYLMRLFTGRPARVVSKVAGLPRPANCD
ncbi:MAG: TusE/DsrC/DsvC family sulfur relay protein [Pseudomonadales bacterium]